MKVEEAASVLRGIVGEANLLLPPVPKDYQFDGLEPKIVASPETTEAAAEVLAAAHRERWVVIPRGGATAMHLGNVPRGADIILSTLRLNGPVVHNPADLTATAQAGTTVASLQRTLAEKGQFLPVDPPFADRATLGGIVAANTFGPNRQGYGTLRDHVLGLTVVHADGTISRGRGRVVKNVAGYDMPKLYIGSLGTLGVIVEVNLRLRPRPEARKSIMGLFPSPAAACRAFAAISRSELLPTAYALLNPTASKAMRDAGTGASTEVRCCLLVGCEETAAAVDREISQIAGILKENGSEAVREFGGEAEPQLWESVRRLPFGGSATEWPEGETLMCRVSVPPSHVAEMMEKAEGESGAKSLEAVVSAYVGAGVIYCLMRPRSASALRDGDCMEVIAKMREIAKGCQGHVVVERAPVSVKHQLDVWNPASSTLPLMRTIKNKFDPDGILNPGRFAGKL